MRYLPVTVFIVLTASLVYAMIVTPVIGSIFGQRRSTLYLVKMNKPVKLYLIRFLLFMENGLRTFVKNPGETLIAVLMLLWFFGYAMYGNFGKGTIYFAEVDPFAAK